MARSQVTYDVGGLAEKIWSMPSDEGDSGVAQSWFGCEACYARENSWPRRVLCLPPAVCTDSIRKEKLQHGKLRKTEE
jgi:hypothetical protein